MTDPLLNFSISIILPSGETFVTRELAYSKYHAIDKAHSKHSERQPNRAAYRAKHPLLNLGGH